MQIPAGYIYLADKSNTTNAVWINAHAIEAVFRSNEDYDCGCTKVITRSGFEHLTEMTVAEVLDLIAESL